MTFKQKPFTLSLILLLIIATTTSAQFKLQTFGKVHHVNKIEKPTDFKTKFPLKAQVWVELTYPSEPAVYTMDAYLIQADGTEKLTNTTPIKTFEPKNGKWIVGWHSLGMVYDAGNYIVRASRESDKQIVAETKFSITEQPATVAAAPVAVIFCDDTDDNFNPIKPVTTIKKGDGVNFLAKLKNGIGAKFFIWAVFEIKDDGDEVLFRDLQENVGNESNRWFATTQKTYLTKPGKYAVYMLKQNATNSGITVRKPTDFYARGVIEVK